MADRDGNPMQYNGVCWSYIIGLTITLNQYKAAGKFDHLTKDIAKEYFKNLSKDPEFHRNVFENIDDALDPHEKAENRYRESIWELSNEAQRILEENESLLKIRRGLSLYKKNQIDRLLKDVLWIDNFLFDF